MVTNRKKYERDSIYKIMLLPLELLVQFYVNKTINLFIHLGILRQI